MVDEIALRDKGSPAFVVFFRVWILGVLLIVGNNVSIFVVLFDWSKPFLEQYSEIITWVFGNVLLGGIAAVSYITMGMRYEQI